MQRITRSFLLFGGCFLAHTAAADPGPITVPPNSYLTQHVASVTQLSRQIACDPVVRRRLARHFHTSSPFLLHYVQKNLVIKTLPKDYHCSVYCLSGDGHPYMISTRLPAGTHVFAYRATGQPALKLSSGNPLLASLPGLSAKAPLELPRHIAPKQAPRIQVALIVKPIHSKILPVKIKEEPIFVPAHGDSSLFIMPKDTPTPDTSGQKDTMTGLGDFWK